MSVILKVLTGSRAYGLEREDSDWDYHGVYITPTSNLLSLGADPKECSGDWYESKGEDYQSWELGHFLQLATMCNPTVLETFVAPVQFATRPWGSMIRDLFPYVLNRKRVLDAFLGYAHNQRTKLFKKPDDPTKDQPADRTWKFATQYLRVLMIGDRLLQTGELVVDMHEYGIAGATVSFLRDVRDGKFSLGDVVDRAAVLESRLKATYKESGVREAPDLDRINEFLLEVRRSSW